jgi:hypothetical protein
VSQAVAIVIGAAIGAAFGVVSAAVKERSARKSAEKQRAVGLFATALDFLGGGTQRRNLGVAAISMYWREFPRYTQLCVEMLIGSAIYLLTESKQKDAGHEIFNFHRIMDLLEEMSHQVSDQHGYEQLQKALQDRLSDGNPKPAKGLWLVGDDLDRDDLRRWSEKLPQSAT